MQTQNLLSSIPQELLYPCVASSVSDFIYKSIPVKCTCKDLQKKIQVVLEGLLKPIWDDLNTYPSFNQETASLQFIARWLDGNPKITQVTLHDLLKNGFSLTLPDGYPIKKEVPSRWISDKERDTEVFIDKGVYGDTTFFNAKTKKWIGAISNELMKILLCGQNIKPLFHQDDILLVYSITTGIMISIVAANDLSSKQDVGIALRNVYSNGIFKDHIILKNQTVNGMMLNALKINDLTAPNFARAELPWQSHNNLTYLKEKILIWDANNEGLFYQTMTLSEGKFLSHLGEIPGNGPVNTANPSDCNLFYSNLHAYFIYKAQGNHYAINGFSIEDLNSSDLALAPLTPLTKGGFAQLVQFKDAVILCAGKMGDPLTFESIEVSNGEIITFPLKIEGTENYKFNRLDSAYIYLDKLLLIGVLTKDIDQGIPEPSNYLVTVNLKTKQMEQKHLLALDIQPTIIEASTGFLYILNSTKNNIIQIQY